MSARLVVLAFVVAACFAGRPQWYQLQGYTFDQYIADFRKSHISGTVEYAERKYLFERKLSEILAFNAEAHSYKKGVNHMTDMTPSELAAMNGRVPDSMVQQPKPSATYVATRNVELPAALDYRKYEYPILTAVKDQGHCGSCWAHASTESVETHQALATGELFVLSQQQLTSCVNNSQQCGGTGGCFGATAQIGWEYISQNGGQTQEWMYGYTSYFGNSGVCKYNASVTVPYVNFTGYVQVDRNNATATLEALVSVGPLAISVDASTWHDYESGIFAGCNYSNNISIDHAVQLIGYGYDETLNKSYWLVRNSWSAKFGENGFIRLEKFDEESCGWNVEWNSNGGGCPGVTPNVIWTCGMCGILYDTAYPNIPHGAPGTPTPAPTTVAPAGEGSSSKAWIAGAVVGGVAGVVIIGLIVFKVFIKPKAQYAGENTDLLDNPPAVPLKTQV